MPAIRRLGQVMRGEWSFNDDRQLRTCVSLARLAPLLVGPVAAPPEPERRLAHPDLPDDQALALLECMEGTRDYDDYLKEFEPNRLPLDPEPANENSHPIGG